MTMWQHTFGKYVWRSVWRCKLDSKDDLNRDQNMLGHFKCF